MFWIEDHLVPVIGDISGDLLENWTLTCYLAGLFKKAKFGSHVLCNSYRNPALLAKMVATLSTLTYGRYVLGIGAGLKEDEYYMYGYDFPAPSVRIKQLEEAIRIMKDMWTKETVSFNGKYHQIKNAYCNPKPYGKIPIMIGGDGEKLILNLVAREADWCNININDMERYENKLKVLEDHCSKVGRDFNEIKKVGNINIAIAKSEANRIVSRCDWLSKALRPTMRLKQTYISGNPSQIIEEIDKRVQQLRVQQFDISF